jgi:hypothetical protein
MTHEWKESSDDSTNDVPNVECSYIEAFDILIEVWERNQIEENIFYLKQSIRLMKKFSERAANGKIGKENFKIC